MDIFVRNVPHQATNKEVKKFFTPPLADCGIDVFHAESMRRKPFATITILSREAGQRFLNQYGVPTNSRHQARAQSVLTWAGKIVLCSHSNRPPSDFSLRSLALEASKTGSGPQNGTAANSRQSIDKTKFPLESLQCGTWDYLETHPCFMSHYTLGSCGDNFRSGSVIFGSKTAIILVEHIDSQQTRIDINYYDCESIVLGNAAEDATISFSMDKAPKFFESPPKVPIVDAMMNLSFHQSGSHAKQELKVRKTSIDSAHINSVGDCLVYRLRLSDIASMATVRALAERNFKMPSTISRYTSVCIPTTTLRCDWTRLNHELTDTGRFGGQPFAVRFQLHRLASNKVLLPLKVFQLIPKVKDILDKYGLHATLFALRRFFRQVPIASPTVEYWKCTQVAHEELLQEYAMTYNKHAADNPYELVSRYQHINLIHKAIVTPTGIHLEGPEPEPTNRVLRRYPDTDKFLRVAFQDEDGDTLRYDPRASQSRIYHERFKGVLDGSIIIAGQRFEFLGFSHSSLRAQACWFMSPIFKGGLAFHPYHVLRELGDFSNIRTPAKCAARIGQNFTDTNSTLDLVSEEVGILESIERNGRDFSDGVGTISEELLQHVWRLYGTRRLLKPTVLQIRFQGFKGMVSLDSRLQHRRLMLRDNMKKFPTLSTWDLEICGAGFRPLPMVLNRQFIKILEDLDIGKKPLLELQKTAVDRLRCMTTTAANTASLIEEIGFTRATGVAALIQRLGDIRLDYRADDFIGSIVEIAIVTRLRDIKYRGRIPVEHGVTLYGIMDETGYLQEGEIFVVQEKGPNGGRRVLEKDKVLVTRSPAMHPGDIQTAKAINVPPESPLQSLSNVVVFSQHGARDLPSKLSGGDLDGDLYNVVWDPQLIPSFTIPAADYPRVAPIVLDHEVTRKDMSDFFVTFMESDVLGMLSNLHMQLADQRPRGTFDLDCIKLAELASTAVDFSKTGIPVDMTQRPRYDRCRPDFMASSPRVKISAHGYLGFEEDDDRDDDAFDGIDIEQSPYRYYKSFKILGRLFRSIDEQQFLNHIHRQNQNQKAIEGLTEQTDLTESLLTKVERCATQLVSYDHCKELAREIRDSYEESLVDLLYTYGPTSNMPVSEAEAFAGTILGRQGGAQGKPLRELSRTMRERFETIVDYAVMRIRKGDEMNHKASAGMDLDELYADYDKSEVEALPRAIACLSIAVKEQGMTDRKLGRLRSFKYIAAGVCLKEWERAFGTLPPA